MALYTHAGGDKYEHQSAETCEKYGCNDHWNASPEATALQAEVDALQARLNDATIQGPPQKPKCSNFPLAECEMSNGCFLNGNTRGEVWCQGQFTWN